MPTPARPRRLRPDAGRCRAAAADRVAPRRRLPSGRRVTASAGRSRSASRRSAWPACWSRTVPSIADGGQRDIRGPIGRAGFLGRHLVHAGDRRLGAAEGRASSVPAPLAPGASAIADAPTGPAVRRRGSFGCRRGRLAGSRRGRLERVSRRAGGPASDPAPPGRDRERRHEGVRRRHERCRACRRRQQPRVAGGHRRFDAAHPVRRPRCWRVSACSCCAGLPAAPAR